MATHTTSQSISFQAQTPTTIPLPQASTFFQATNTYTQPIPAYTQQQPPYYYQYNQPVNPCYPQQWPRPHTGWPEPIPNLTTYRQPTTSNQNNDHGFAQSFSKGLKLEFPKLEGENPIG
jgi:hypothetical protein